MDSMCRVLIFCLVFTFTGVVESIICYDCSFGDSNKRVDDCARPNASTKTIECDGRCEVGVLSMLYPHLYYSIVYI